MKGVWSTLALVAVAAGLGAYIYFVDADKPATETKEKVFSVAADDVEELRITAKGETSVLRKTNGTWALVEPVATEADANEVTSLLGSLTSLELNREVDPKAANLAEFGLAAPKADISYKAKGGATGRVRLGDATPTGGDLYAVKDDGTRVFLVGTFVETNLARSPFELRDKRVLRFERDKADGLEIATASGTSTFSRTNSDWRVTAPSNARGDYGAIEGLLTRLSTTMMTGIETTDVADLKKYGLDKPAATLVVKSGSSSATIAVGTSAEGKAYARDLSRTLVFTVDPSFGTELLKSGDEYRRKDLFDFRAFTAKQVTVTRGTETVVFKKVSGAATNTIDKWTVTVGGATRDVDTAKMDDLLGKLTNLRADGFVTAVPAAAGAAALKVQAEYGEASTKEEGSIARVGADVYGARPDEAGALKLPANVFDDALKALDAVLAPPAPPTAAPATAPVTGEAPGKKE